MPFFFGFDPTFFLLIPAFAFAMWAQWKVKSTFQKFAQVPAANGLTGREMANAIMQRNGITDVSIEEIGGQLSDHYDPGAHTVRLSSDIYDGHSISAIAVAAHEVGHVIQHQRGYVPLSFRTSFAPVAGLGSSLAMPLVLIGLLFHRSMPFANVLMDVGILFFAAAVLFHFVTLPVEFDASRRALAQLTETGAVMPQEVAGAKQVLDAAALTYVAAAAVAAIQLLRLLLLRGNRR
jgi:Zn-dependent membrane protease YugP